MDMKEGSGRGTTAQGEGKGNSAQYRTIHAYFHFVKDCTWQALRQEKELAIDAVGRYPCRPPSRPREPSHYAETLRARDC